MKKDEDFETWWNNEGMNQSRTITHKEFANIIWSNGHYKANKEFESRSCTNCKWCKLGGEFENDECHNTSLSAHLDQGTMVCDDFCCNRWEKR